MSWATVYRLAYPGLFLASVANQQQAADDTFFTKQNTKFQLNGTTNLWGKVLPITYGRRRITGFPLQAGLQRQRTTSSVNWVLYKVPGGGFSGRNRTFAQGIATFRSVRTSTFAYVFGAPGNITSKQILLRLWIDGVKVFDATTG